MTIKTLIEWADSTLNTAWGCTKVSAGCQNCYMFELSKMFNKDPTKPNPRKAQNIIADLNKYKNSKIIFVNSMTDTYHENFDFDLISSWFDIFISRPEQEFLILTKRINRAYNFHKKYQVPENCWIGTSIENKSALHRLEKLKRIKAKIRYVSFEPLLEDLGEINLNGIQWAIVGGESSRVLEPRPMKEVWAINIKNQCRKSKTAFFFKQMGGRIKHESGTWGSPYLQGEKYLEMPICLSTKTSVQK